MIAPTRTVCYAIPEEDAEQELKVTHASPFGLEIEYSKGLYGLLNYSEVRRIIVREEPEGPAYPYCNKNFNPLNPCDCGDCLNVLGQYSGVRPISMAGRAKIELY